MKLKAELSIWLAFAENQLRQKSRETWLRLGDRNSKFFHASVKVKQARNCISQLYSASGKRVSDYEELKTMAPAYYSKLSNQSDY